MDWRRILAYITGTVDQELLLRNEFLAAENKILRRHVRGRVQFTPSERRSLAEIGKRLGRKALEELATIVRPDTILGWYRKLIARKFDGSKKRRGPGRPKTAKEIEELVLRVARENRSWGFHRIAGALASLGIQMSHETVGKILRRHGLEPAPERRKGTTWKDFIDAHKEVLAGTDFFTVEVLTLRGLVTYYVLFFLKLSRREVHVAGLTPHPDESWMKQVARNVTMAGDGFLQGIGYLIHDRDGKFCPAFRAILESAGVDVLTFPPSSPNLNAFAERWIRGFREEGLSRLILFGERSLRHVLSEYLAHFHTERPHQGLGNQIPFPTVSDRLGEVTGSIECRERLGGLIRFYFRKVG